MLRGGGKLHGGTCAATVESSQYEGGMGSSGTPKQGDMCMKPVCSGPRGTDDARNPNPPPPPPNKAESWTTLRQQWVNGNRQGPLRAQRGRNWRWRAVD